MKRALKLVHHALHPSEVIRDELKARGWSMAELARRLPGDYGLNYVALDFYLTIGAETPDMRMGVYAEQIAAVFGVDLDFFSNLESSWLKATGRAA